MFTKSLRAWVDMLKEGEIFLAKVAYEEYFADMEEATFYQLLARLHKEKSLGKLAKGLYYRPYANDITLQKKPSEEKLVEFFTNKNKNGMVVGSHLYKKLNLIDETNSNYQVYTNVFEIKSVRVLHGFEVKTVNIDFRNENYLRNIAMLEVINDIDRYDNVNIEALAEFIKDYALHFDQSALAKVLAVKSYKKRNIAIIMDILNCYNVRNTLSKLLNKASKYQKSKYITLAMQEEGKVC